MFGFKILTKKQIDEILKRVAACQIICDEYISDIEANTYMTENLADIAVEVGGVRGAAKVTNTIHKRYRKLCLKEARNEGISDC